MSVLSGFFSLVLGASIKEIWGEVDIVYREKS